MHRLRTISSIMRGLNNKSITIHFQDQSGAASLRCKNRAEISDPFVNRSPIRYGFCVGAQAIRYSVDIALVCTVEREQSAKHDQSIFQMPKE